MSINNESIVPRGRDSQRGQVIVMVAVCLVVLLSMAALVIDLGILYTSYQQLQAATQAAAIAGGQALPSATSKNDVTTAVNKYSTQSLSNVTMVSTTLACLTTLTNMGVICPPATNANAVIVKQQATVGMFFAKLFGVKSLTITATATATAGGGRSGTYKPYNIMMILDTTASMGSGSDTGCTSGSGSYSPEQCAQFGIQQLLGNLGPCAANLASCVPGTSPNVQNPLDQVGLMVFPGLTPLHATPLDNPPVVNTSQAKYDYSCPSSNPTTVPYNSNPGYLIVPLSSDYRSSDSSTTLNTSSELVVAAGGGSCKGVQTPGGQGTFFAGAIDAATNYLTNTTVNPRANSVQNVMILLSDGNAGADSSQMAGSATTYTTTRQCQQAVTSATNAINKKILIYSISYGSETSGCSTGDTLTPCQTMQQIASLPNGTGSTVSQYFFSVPQSKAGQGTICAGGRSVSSLNQVFAAIAGDLTVAHIIPNGTP